MLPKTARGSTPAPPRSAPALFRRMRTLPCSPAAPPKSRASAPGLTARYSPDAHTWPARRFTVLISYGPDMVDQYRGAAGYIDPILKGEKSGDLPVQAPTKYELVIN